jgi:hypothetical protein
MPEEVVMRRQTFLALLIVISLIALHNSCLSYSLYPWFGKEVQTFDERLLGKWGNEAESYTVKRGPERTYLITAKDERNTTDFRAVLGKVGDSHYLDLKTEQSTEALDPWELEVHQLCKLAIEPDRLRVVCLDDEKLEEMVDAGLLRGARVQKDKYLVVSGTPELQEFVTKHGPEAGIWIKDEEEEKNWLARM